SDLAFNRKTVPRFIENFRHTLSFASLLNGGKIFPIQIGSEAKPKIKVGDYVQWESNGELQFEVPQRITGFYDDDHAIVEGSSTGIPVEELTKVDPPAESDK